MEEEFLILQCPACERSVKIRSDAAGTRMGCPYCKEPVEVSESGDGSEPHDDDPAGSDSPPLVFRRIQATDVGDDSGKERQSASGSHSSQKGERRKHRKRQETPEWDETETGNADATEGEETSDDDTVEFLEMDPDSEGGVRLKRIRRKKLLTKKDKFIRGVTIAVFVAAASLAALIIYAAVVQTLRVADTDKKTIEEIPIEVRAAIEKALREGKPVSPDLTHDEEQAALKILGGFLAAKTIDARLGFVRKPESQRPRMEAYYARDPEDAKVEWPAGEVAFRKKMKDQDRYFIVLGIDYGSLGQRVVAIEQTRKSMKLDWPTAVGYQPIPLEDFREKMPKDPVVFWVKVKPSDYYNFSFSDPREYEAVELSYPGREEFKLIGYFNREREWAPALSERLKQGLGPSLIVQLQYPENPEDDKSQVEIVSILADTWWEE